MNYQLLKLEFKKFGGEPREWITFWSQFSTIDWDPQMPPETKCQYLFQATAENSEAREAVESFPPSADNYPKVIEYIKSRFGEDEMLVEIYVRDLLQNVLQSVRAEGLKSGARQLQEKKEDWPVSKVQYDLEAIEEERRKTVVAGFVAKKPEENPWYLNLYEGKREVTLPQILRVIAWMLRFKPSEYKGDIISQEELDSAEKSLVKIIQSESIGIDLGGPLYLEDGQKVWSVIFTCGVYRAVHLELVTSLSTEALVGAVERFVARRGCPAVIYSDNGTNLVGLRNELYRVNFGMKWKLNPPAAPWWGGWIERIVGLTKNLLRRLLGKRVVNYEEMVTILENCERVINARPLTYIAEDNDDLVPLTPEMFLREPRTEGEIDLNEFRCNFGKSYEKRKRLLKEFSKRFRSEYLGLLVHHDNRKKQRQLKVRDIVLVEVENRKQINWPMGKITKVFPGTDNVRRLVEVKTKSGFMKRAVQRLFPLEVPSEDKATGSLSQRRMRSSGRKHPVWSPCQCKRKLLQ
ncbi:hypothetical protein LAZ67_3001186 [Cordylochernes scorpioides]|uniref:Integrase catalytic domain-containing protein n=1 Tax=Cordylochernes scorpioides TaxID=51811 RepID=A0ABY6KA12_9ARAC|nr:hypothetical protein LAZ67_3001186 [Cordylochernes scorpioides]